MTDQSNKTESDDTVDLPEDDNEQKRRKALTKIVATAGIATAMSGTWKKPLLSSGMLGPVKLITRGE